jgi:hypothetical protein
MEAKRLPMVGPDSSKAPMPLPRVAMKEAVAQSSAANGVIAGRGISLWMDAAGESSNEAGALI